MGISRFDGQTWTSYTEVQGHRIPAKTIIVDKWNRTWFLGKVSFNGAEWTVHTSENTPPQLLDMISYVVDRNGVEWIGTNSLGLWRFDGSAWKNYTSADGLPEGSLLTLTFDRDNILWVSSYNGFVAFDGRSFSAPPDGPDTLITSIAVDSRNRKWVGTMKSGVWCFDGVQWVNHLPPDDIIMQDNMVQNLVVDGDDVKWIIGAFGNLFRLSDTGWAKYASGPGNSQFKAVAIGPDNVKWFMTYDSGVLSLETDPPIPTSASTATPHEFHLHEARPNPFNPSTTIEFTLAAPAPVKLEVYSLTGQKVSTLVNGPLSAGSHSAVFDGSKYASGVYFYRLVSGGVTKCGKMLLLKS